MGSGGVTRVALLPAGPDPFLLAYWFRNYRRVWASEVDELHVLVCGQADPAAKRYIVEQAGDAKVTFHTKRLDHGMAIALLMEQTTAEYVVLLEDDAYVRNVGAVAERFRRLEAGLDVIGGPRGSASSEIIEAAETRFGGPWFADTGEAGHALWPCFLFARRAVLLDTDRRYGARQWAPGEMVEGLNLTAGADLSADTFASTTYQLRANGARIEAEGQYRVTNTSQMSEWITNAPWFHVGSLSSGYGYVIADDSGGTAIRDAQGSDWARRASWWERFARTADALPDHLTHYRAEIATFIERSGLSRSDIDAWDQAYQGWITWQETP